MKLAKVKLIRDPECNQWLVEHCPFCGKKHWHGAGKPDSDPILGSRQSHCSPGGEYILRWVEDEN